MITPVIDFQIVAFYQYFHYYAINRLDNMGLSVICIRKHDFGQVGDKFAHIRFPQPGEHLTLDKVRVFTAKDPLGKAVRYEVVGFIREFNSITYMDRPIGYDIGVFMPKFMFN